MVSGRKFPRSSISHNCLSKNPTKEEQEYPLTSEILFSHMQGSSDWVFDLSLQLAVLKEESLLSVKEAVEKYKVENERLQERRVPQEEVNSWGKIPKESVRSFLTALCNRDLAELTPEVSNATRKYLRKMAQAHRKVSYPTSLGGASSGIRESVKIGGSVGTLSFEEQDAFFEEVTRLAEILNISVDMAHFGTGCLLIVLILSRPLLVHQKQAFCGELHAYLQSKDADGMQGIGECSLLASFASLP